MELDKRRQEAKRQKEEQLEFYSKEWKKLRSSSCGVPRETDDIATVQQLPEEVLLDIFSYLDGKQLLHCYRVCNLWKSLASDIILWRNLFKSSSEGFSSVSTDVVTNVSNGLKCSDPNVRAVTLECMSEIVTRQYSLNVQAEWMDSFAKFAFDAVENDVKSVALQAIEFWSCVCEAETKGTLLQMPLQALVPKTDPLNIADDAMILGDDFDFLSSSSAASSVTCSSTLFNNVSKLTKVLLKCLLKQDEAAPEPWNYQQAAGACFSLLARSGYHIHYKVVPIILEFYKINIKKNQWRNTDASILVLGCALCGTTNLQLTEFVRQHIGELLSVLNGANVHPLIEETCAWTFAQICEYEKKALSAHGIQDVVDQLVVALKKKTNKAKKNVCWCVGNLLDGSGGFIPSLLSIDLIDALMVEAENCGSKDLKSAVFDSLLHIIENITPKESTKKKKKGNGNDNENDEVPSPISTCILHAVPKLIHMLKNSTNNVLQNLKSSMDLYVQATLCYILGQCIEKLHEKMTPFAEEMLPLFIHSLNNRELTALSGEIEAITSLFSIVPADSQLMEKHLPQFLPFVLNMLSSMKDKELVSLAVTTISDLSSNVSNTLTPFVEQIITTILNAIKSGGASKEQLSELISCLGDVAVCTGGNFDVFLPDIMHSLYVVLDSLKKDKDHNKNTGLAREVNHLRQSTFETFSFILQALEKDGKQSLFYHHIDHVMGYISELSNDTSSSSSVTGAAVGLIGDCVSTFKEKIVEKLATKQPIKELIYLSLIDVNYKTRDIALWAKEAITRLNPDFFEKK